MPIRLPAGVGSMSCTPVGLFWCLRFESCFVSEGQTVRLLIVREDFPDAPVHALAFFLSNSKKKSTSPVMSNYSSVGLREKIGCVLATVAKSCVEGYSTSMPDPAFGTGPPKINFKIQLHFYPNLPLSHYLLTAKKE